MGRDDRISGITILSKYYIYVCEPMDLSVCYTENIDYNTVSPRVLTLTDL